VRVGVGVREEGSPNHISGAPHYVFLVFESVCVPGGGGGGGAKDGSGKLSDKAPYFIDTR